MLEAGRGAAESTLRKRTTTPRICTQTRNHSRSSNRVVKRQKILHASQLRRGPSSRSRSFEKEQTKYWNNSQQDTQNKKKWKDNQTYLASENRRTDGAVELKGKVNGEDEALGGEFVRTTVLKEDWEILLAILRHAEAMKEDERSVNSARNDWPEGVKGFRTVIK